MIVLGIDIGGSGIKGALVDVATGELNTERHRIPTPAGGHPDDVVRVVSQLVQHFDWQGTIGVTFPAVIKDGVALTAANIDSAWIGVNVQELLQQVTGCPVTVINDADAAGIAEMRFGAGKGHTGVVLVLTIGTGIGSAIFVQDHLLPNSELGHLEIRGKIGERRASDRSRRSKNLRWQTWARRLIEYLARVEALLYPDLLIIGGGVSKKHHKYMHLLKTRARITPAYLRNEAGIIGAALAVRHGKDV